MARCCFADCESMDAPSQRIALTPPPDGAPVVLWGHDGCFARSKHPAVEPDDPGDLGRIPVRARCVRCGRPLPIVGWHPFVMDVGSGVPPSRFWCHAECLPSFLASDVANGPA